VRSRGARGLEPPKHLPWVLAAVLAAACLNPGAHFAAVHWLPRGDHTDLLEQLRADLHTAFKRACACAIPGGFGVLRAGFEEGSEGSPIRGQSEGRRMLGSSTPQS
jgi:hypothetical protein